MRIVDITVDFGEYHLEILLIMSSLLQNFLRIQSPLCFRRLDFYKKFLRQFIEIGKITEFNIRESFLFLSNNS